MIVVRLASINPSSPTFPISLAYTFSSSSHITSLHNGHRCCNRWRRYNWLRTPHRPEPQVVQQQEADHPQCLDCPLVCSSFFVTRRFSFSHIRSSFSLITSSTNGYDGSMMNGLQSLTQWEDSFNHPQGGLLGLLNAIQYIGSIGSLPIAPYITDGLGRKMGIFLGALVMCGGK